ncbi:MULTISPECIES: hypothetical protein [Haloferacaceae]|uniref:Small CPxCG-related zinc finger protein n=1 Tax=Halorubrum glutamatedens TaxID=2707018 RepID=A0ABD5QTP3_9EURY|nr:hypothetical protein [Halobellus captivus]
MRSFAAPETHFRIEVSKPGDHDGHQVGEPARLECDECGASVPIDGPDGHETAVDELPHSRGCSQRDVKSAWWMDHYAGV